MAFGYVASFTKFNARALILGSDGAIYGQLAEDGRTRGIFSFRLETRKTQILRRFEGASIQWQEMGALIEGNDGALYGTLRTQTDPDKPAAETIFKINKDGTGYRTLFTPEPLPNGDQPWLSPLARGRDGLLYGALYYEGEIKFFMLDQDGTSYSEILTSFQEFGDVTGISVGKDSIFYGTIRGSVFKLSPPETPNVLIAEKGDQLEREITIHGTRGAQYQLLRSTDLKAWNPIFSFSMPAAGLLSYIESENLPAAFYRALWMP